MKSINFKSRSILPRKVGGFCLAVLFTGLFPVNLQALEIVHDDLPGPEHLAASLSDPQMRTETLLTMIAVAHLLDYGLSAELTDIDRFKARFRDERAWLDRLSARYVELPMRGSQLDPAAWFVQLELDRASQSPGFSVSPLGPRTDSLMRQLFDRSDERVAAAVLPEVMQRMEVRSTALWESLLDAVLVNEALLAVVAGMYGEWFDSWWDAEPPLASLLLPDEAAQDPAEDDGETTGEVSDVLGEALNALWALAGSVVLSGPEDASRLQRLRFDLLTALSELDEAGHKDAEYILALATAIDGLHEGKYLQFTEILLWVVSDLLMPELDSREPEIEPLFEPLFVPAFELQGEPQPDAVPDSGDAEEDVAEAEAVVQDLLPRSRVPRLLAELLPGLSNTFAGEFSSVDPRINSVLAVAFDAAQFLQAEQRDPDRLPILRRDLGDAAARLALLIPDLNYYFDQPVRQRISNRVAECVVAAGSPVQPETAGMSREQFDDCLQSLIGMAGNLVSREELAGDPDGPFGADQLRRELAMPPWQRINFSLGYLHERFPTGCEMPAEPLPNPLEWSVLANLVTWLARQSPVYFQTPENEALIVEMRQQGLALIQNLSQQVDCISGTGTGINDPVSRGLVDYRLALDELVAGIREAEIEFRGQRLKVGADVVLHGDASQATAYRSEALFIGPCDPGQICEMTGELEATRALIGLFPDPYLIADQTGLGSMEICYENVQWVNRRGEPVRSDDPHVANYYGQLSFDLVGRFRENGETHRVFGSNFVSPDEYHYLFAAATDEVREDSCPTEWVGTKIVTPLNNDGRIRVVPNRLTYLAGTRRKPSEIIASNWGRGAEWRDWFVTGLGVTPHEYEPDKGISDRVGQQLQTLYQAEQSVIYNDLLRPRSRGWRRKADSLLNLQEELTARKALVLSYISLFYPEHLVQSDSIRGLLEGHGALLDTEMLRRFQQSSVAVASINDTGLTRLERFQAEWARQPDAVRRTGSISSTVAHAMIRLNSLYREFFRFPARPAENAEVIEPVGSRG